MLYKERRVAKDGEEMKAKMDLEVDRSLAGAFPLDGFLQDTDFAISGLIHTVFTVPNSRGLYLHRIQCKWWPTSCQCRRQQSYLQKHQKVNACGGGLEGRKIVGKDAGECDKG